MIELFNRYTFSLEGILTLSLGVYFFIRVYAFIRGYTFLLGYTLFIRDILFLIGIIHEKGVLVISSSETYIAKSKPVVR